MKRSIIVVAISCAALLVAFLMMKSQGEGVTPLMRAAKSGNADEIRRQINAGAEVDKQSRYGWTALMFATWQGHEDIVKALLEVGADPNIASGTVPSAFETVGGHPSSSALQEAIRNRHFGIAKTLISARAKIDAGAAALAGQSGDVQFLNYLQSQGAEWNLSSGNAFHATPLCAAASSGKLAAVRWLVEHGADPNVVAAGQTALKEAAYNDEPEIVDYLLEHGANPNLVYGSTEEAALFTAVTKHTDDRAYPANLSIIQMLLQHEADQNHRAFDGQHTALDFINIQKSNTLKYLTEASTEESKARIRASITHMDAVINMLHNNQGEQGGADQPATAPELKSEGKDKPNPESEVRPQ